MSKLTWFPFYVEDFRVDTLELETDEIGVYFGMLVLCYARGGPLPGNEEDLKRIIQRQFFKFHGHSYNRIVPKLLNKYFYKDEKGDWRQKRVEYELERARSFSEKQRDRVTKRWAEEVDLSDKPGANGSQTVRKRSANGSQKVERSLKNNEFVDTNNNTIHNILDTNVSNNKREPSSLEILCEVLSEATASDLLTHRQAKKSKLTPRAAKELVKAFKAYGDPEAAAAEMMLRGWIGFKPDWMENNQRAGPIQNSDPNRRGGLARLYREICERENEIEAKVSDGNVLRLPSVHGVG